MDKFHFSNSGNKSLDSDELRTFCVSVRLNAEELEKLNQVRGERRKGETLRVLAFKHLPAAIPSINAELRSDLGRALGNLSTAASAMRDGQYIEVKSLVDELRDQLLRAVK